MSNVIKGGNCSFLPLDGLGEGGDENVSCFNSLSTLMDIPSELRAKGSSECSEFSRVDDSAEDFKEKVRQRCEEMLEKARTRARKIIEDATEKAKVLEKEAERTLRQARKRSEELESQAYTQGFKQGKKDGEELGRRQYEASAQRLERVISALQEQGGRLVEKYESQLVKLVLEVSKQVVHKEVQTDPQIVVRCIKAAMEQVVQGSSLSIHLHPIDAERVGDEIKQELSGPGRHPVKIVPDPKIQQGGCFIETEFGLVDATMKARWQAVVQAIKQVLQERTGGP